MRHAAAIALLLLLPLPAVAQESLDDLDKKPAATSSDSKKADAVSNEISSGNIAEVNGYVDNRFQAGWVNPFVSWLPTKDVPSLQEILEGNVQLKVHLGKKAFVY